MNGIILASGFSKRMGKNKLLMNIGDELIIEKVIRTIKKCNISNIILVGREEEIINIGINEGIKTIKNNFAINGQSESIKLGLKEVDLNHNYMFFCGDQPFIDKESVNKLIKVSAENSKNIIIPKFKDKTGSPIIFPISLKKELESLNGDMGGREVIKNNKDKIKYVGINNSLFLQDIDTIKEYEEFIKLIKR
ncbi:MULTISPECIES: NTP transferase domain-containing protein [Clostridium]|jgi:molybdenum cofactor cytidylyltransferase|uniref:Purine catabolism protein PucB n=1 Tax=bioreactor metagenome TaxID=1076179 RepID=A0A645A6C6_9ZZZZ|nr:NTP transferase domain-containing protein [Clostridium sp. C8]KLE15448.1 molybdenum hydroxylase [Clostridium sp. C8]